MTKLLTPSVLALAVLLAGCATYESQPVHHTSVTGYGHGAITYSSVPPTYYAVPAPAPVYVAPPVYVGPPVYVTPAPAFNMHIESGPGFRRHPHAHGSRQRFRSGNAAGSQVGGPGWTGSVWSR